MARQVTESKLRILQINMQNSILVSNELPIVMEQENIDIACLQETYSIRNKLICAPRNSRAIIGGVPPKAAIVVQSPDISITKISQLSNSHAVTLEIKRGNDTWILASQYAQYSHNIEPYAEWIKMVAEYARGKKLLIATDINAKSTLWHADTTDDRGLIINEILAEHNLFVLNREGQPPTFDNGRGQSEIDITIVNEKALPHCHKWEVRPRLVHSDHNGIIIELQGIIATKEQEEHHYNMKKANWDKLKQVVATADLASVQGSIDFKVHALTQTLKKAQEEAIPKHNGAFKPRTLWTQELTILRRDSRKKRRLYQRAVTAQEKERRLIAYREAKAKYKDRLFATRKQHWDNYVKTQLSDNIWGMPYKLLTEKIKSPTILATLKQDNGNMTKGWRSTAEYLLAKLLPDDEWITDTQDHIEMRESFNAYYTTEMVTSPFTNTEVLRTILKMKKGKAPGPDGIYPETLHQVAPQITPFMTDILNEALGLGRIPAAWKTANAVIIKKAVEKEATDPRSYRPICLLNILGKVQERLLCDRLQAHRELKGLNEHQFGFRKNKSIDDAVNHVLHLVEETRTKYAIVIFIDIQGAFDNMWWPALFQRLRELQVPASLYNSLLDYCQDRTVQWRTGSKKVLKKITKGCPQGSILGPVFWDITIEPLLNLMDEDPNTEGIVGYADDISVVVSANSRAELEQKANNTLTVMNMWCQKYKLNIAPAKTLYMLVKGNLQRDPIIRLENKTISRKKTARYLGIHLDDKLSFLHHIRTVTDKAVKVLHKLARINTTEYRMPLYMIKTYYYAVYESTVSFGSSIWAHRLRLSTYVTAARGGQRNVLLRLSGAFGTTSTEALCVVLGTFPVDISIRYRAANYWLKRGRPDKVRDITGEELPTKLHLKRWRITTWQEQWDASTKGRRVYSFFPNIAERLKMKHADPGKGMVHFLTGHGPYPTYLQRLYPDRGDLCACGQLGTPEHVVLSCSKYDMREQITLTQAEIKEALRDIDKWKQISDIADRISGILREEFRREQYRRVPQRMPNEEETDDSSSTESEGDNTTSSEEYNT